MSQEWNRRVDKTEASAKRKAKEVKNREFFEKVKKKQISCPLKIF